MSLYPNQAILLKCVVQVVFACGFLKNNLQFSIDSAVIRRQLRTLHEEWVQGWQNLFARRFVNCHACIIYFHLPYS